MAPYFFCLFAKSRSLPFCVTSSKKSVHGSILYANVLKRINQDIRVHVSIAVHSIYNKLFLMMFQSSEFISVLHRVLCSDNLLAKVDQCHGNNTNNSIPIVWFKIINKDLSTVVEGIYNLY